MHQINWRIVAAAVGQIHTSRNEHDLSSDDVVGIAGSCRSIPHFICFFIEFCFRYMLPHQLPLRSLVPKCPPPPDEALKLLTHLLQQEHIDACLSQQFFLQKMSIGFSNVYESFHKFIKR
eukprot:TRINITY_DN7071_c0_g2_i4.p1 TRINITY_DN7071_c0_g2~~TRINITY_DN7071_c0_g2_i4.p1  ORF type:complete len:120 (-),score=6.66 TRINITY_DN7071_c0_g2_i4:427-786(-)